MLGQPPGALSETHEQVIGIDDRDGWGVPTAEAGGPGVVCPGWPGQGKTHGS